MTLTFGSLFAGIGGFDLGLERAGMECRWQVEIDGNCREILAHHRPDIDRSISDVTKAGRRNLEPVDLICGGFPCQDLSVAGKREGLSGERSGLWFEFHRVLAELEPRWVVIENVPGLLSNNGGADFAVLLRGLVKLGYGVCWRVFDAQYDNLAQRRERVFIVGHLGTGRAAQILFESDGAAWNPAPSREGRERDTALFEASDGMANTTPWDIERCRIVDATNGPCKTLAADHGRGHGVPTVFAPIAAGQNSSALTPWDCHSKRIHAIDGVAPTLQAMPKGGHQGGPQSPTIAYGVSENQRAEVRLTEYSRQITSGGGKPGQRYPCVAFTERTREQGRNFEAQEELAYALTNPGSGGRTHSRQIAGRFGVRRLTPTECERLQGFPDGWTAVNGMKDSPRYRMLGNAVAVPVAEWLGRRIMEVENGT